MDEKQKLLKEIGIIQDMPKPQQWRAAADFAAKVNPEVRAEQRAHAKELAAIRAAQDNKFASAKHSGLRFGLSIPLMTLQAIRGFDPEFLMEDKQKGATTHDTNKTVRQLMKMFPEFRVPQEI